MVNISGKLFAHMHATFTWAVSSTLFSSLQLSGVTLAFITPAEFQQAVTSNGNRIPTNEQYHNLVSKAGPVGHITNKRELAMFLANILHESAGLTTKEEWGPPPAGTYHYPKLDRPGKLYHGRGYIQLTWSYNYKAASLALYNDLRLLDYPEQVASHETVAWDTAFWFWSANVHNQKGVKEGNFGATVRAINGEQECGPQGRHSAKARERFDKYIRVLRAFELHEKPIETGCYN